MQLRLGDDYALRGGEQFISCLANVAIPSFAYESGFWIVGFSDFLHLDVIFGEYWYNMLSSDEDSTCLLFSPQI